MPVVGFVEVIRCETDEGGDLLAMSRTVKAPDRKRHRDC
jgi:hypothetical protein